MCRGYITPGDVYNYAPEDSYVDSKFTQIFYLIEGTAGLIKCDGEYIASYNNGALDVIPEYKDYFDNHFDYVPQSSTMMLDVRTFQGKAFNFEAGSQGGTWLCINPIPATKHFDAKILKPNTHTTIVGDGKEHVIICAKGKITARQGEKSDTPERILNQFNYVRVLNDKVVNIAIPGDSEALYLTR